MSPSSGVSEATGRTRQWLSTVDCAIALGVSDDTVRREIAAGLLKAVTRRPEGDNRRIRIRVHVDALRDYARHDPEQRAQVERWICSTRNVTPHKPH